MAADYTSSKYSATSATLWACRCCVSVCMWVFALCMTVCVCMCVCHLVWAFYYDTCVVCLLWALFVACTHLHPHTHTHTRRQVNKHACITKAVKTLARTNEHGNNISYTVWQPLHTHTHTYAACCIWMCAKASLKLLLLTDKGLGTAAAQI